MFHKILIANRGEIAVRVARACDEMGIRSATIFADADRHALHVKKADEAHHIGADPLAGYLDINRIINLAVLHGCDAVHPGYGFLAENAELAEQCMRHGISFIGPTPSVMRALGDKVSARRVAAAAGVPTTPGSEGETATPEEAEAAAKKIGYPVMIKAAAGGGGRGIRRCENAADVRRHFPRAAAEAEAAFGNGALFVEKCIEEPRHIEVQILGDSHGNIVHLYERDCSVQRRNQKLLEIAPSPQISEEERGVVCDYAVRAARAAGYSNAGTAEFLLDRDRNFYFMEMNTRLQVEHPVSEQITGVDIVQEQIRVATGEPLSIKQKDIRHRGVALEFRINAEDPQNNFLPSFGRITRYYAPGGPGVRTDSAIYTGYTIPPYYDSLCAKLVVWALDWERALARSQRALRDMMLAGVKTTIPYYQQILRHSDIRRADFDTAFVANNPQLLDYPRSRPPEDLALALAAALHIQARKAQRAAASK